MLENDTVRLPEIIVFAGSNGSGKSTIAKMSKIERKIFFKKD